MLKKYDAMQLTVFMVYLFLLVSLLYMPFELNPEGLPVHGFKSIFNILISYLYLKWVLRIIGVETNKSLDNSMFLIWITFILSLYLKIFTGKQNGEEVMWIGIIFEITGVSLMTLILYVEQALYYTGRRIE